jgi:iron complex transport system ATP-binding protein
MFEAAPDLEVARQALFLTGMAGMAQRQAGTLSGGERQRLALARALAAESGWLLLDEPTSALDPEHQLRVMGLLERLCHEEGRSVCLASHDLNLAALFCDRLVLLHQGRVAAVGSPEEVLTPELLVQVYGVDTMVDREPGRGRPRVSMLAPANIT